MYEQFYGLEKGPFALTPDPRFLYMTEAHQNAKAGLTYAILARKGFTVLTGDAGTGKTTLLRSVINSMPADRICFSLLLNPTLTPEEFLDAAVADLGLPRGLGKAERLRKLEAFLLQAHTAGKITVLFVDEAHRLSIETLEEIRLLTNFETECEKLLQIVLIGQDELDEMLDRRELRQLKQRVGVRLHISPLSMGATGSYISHRWSCVSPSIPPFSAEAILAIGHFSAGIPRVINAICDNALLIAYAEGAGAVTKDHIGEVSRDLRLKDAGGKRPTGERSEARNELQIVPKLELQVPRPVALNLDEHPLPQLGKYKSARAWWPPFQRAAKG